jgi:molybdenum cofactor guanylyltransferase
MGSDKRLLLVDGEPMLRRVVRAVADSSDEVIVAVSRAHPLPDGLLDGLSVRVIDDLRTDAGPLAGLEAGLSAARHELVVVVAADMPWIDGDLVRRLVAELSEGDADVAVVATERGPEPLLAAWRRDVALRAATSLLDSGERRVRVLLDALRSGMVADPGGRSVWNVNEPADLARVIAEFP